MPLQSAFGERLDLIANVMLATGACGHDNVDGVAVNRVACAFPPKEIPVERQLELIDGRQFQRWMQIDMIGRAKESGLAEVSAAGKPRVEGFQIQIVRLPPTAPHVGLESEARLPGHSFKGVAGV